jgi:hypothetical protein
MVAAGAAVRLVQLLGNPSLWGDELSLVLNVTERGLVELLTQGLDWEQVAPVGYLLPTKLAVLLLGEGELALRVVPLAASLLALILFWRLAQKLLEPVGALVATAGFALNPLLISLGSVVKQYSTDVLATVLVLWALRWLSDPKGSLSTRVLVGAGAGAIGFLSIPSVIVAAAAITALLYQAWATGGLQSRDSRSRTLMPLVVWAAMAGGAALWAQSILTPGLQEYMTGFWAGRGAFAPPFTEDPTWVLVRGGATLDGVLFSAYMGQGAEMGPVLTEPIKTLILLGALLGAPLLAPTALMRLGGFGWVIAIPLPFLLALGLSAFAIYPIDPRTSAFLVPLLLLLVGALVALLVQVLSRSAPWVRRAVPLLPLLLFAVILVERPPIYVVQRDREVVRELSLRRGVGEPVFVHALSEAAIHYYGSRFGVGDPILFGTRDLGEDLTALYAFQGEPSLWVLFTNSDTRDSLLCYLDEIGRETDRVVLDGGIPDNPVSLHRYDLTDEARLVSPSAASFPLTAEAFGGTTPRCRRQPWSSPS